MTNKTERTFLDKWRHNERLAFEQTIEDGSDINRWILTRNGFTDNAGLRRYLHDKRRVLDAGCGNGRVTALLRECSLPERTHLVAVDLVAAEIAARNLSCYRNIEVREADILGDLSRLGTFDFIYCQEVLHHTSDPERAFRNVASLLAPGGEIAIYVYRRKAPAREFVDDYVRERMDQLPYEDAMKVAAQITALGRALAELNAEVDVPGVPVLGIEAGRYDVQRFVYHFFAKCFWNPSLSFNDNAVINYDWYHPQLCSRHTLEEVRRWFEMADLRIVHECVDHYGITVRGCLEREPRHASPNA